MKAKRQKWFWILDAVLLGGFLATYYLDLTGLPLHQWLGIGVAALAGYHLAVHWAWVKGVADRLTCSAGRRARLCFGVDAALLLGMALITLTGLVISTWLNLSLSNYLAWRNLHIGASVATLAAVVIKVGLHWRWILGTARRVFAPRAVGLSLPLQPVRVTADAKLLDRRHFLALMGGVGLAALLAGSRALDQAQVVLAEGPATPDPIVPTTAPAALTPVAAATVATSATQVATSTASATATPAPTLKPTVAAAACTVRCPKHCSYPGRCSRYTDRNGNKLCDLGECL